MAKQVIIGIAGGSASGKSTFSQALVQALQERGKHTVKLINADRFMNPQRPDAPKLRFSLTGEEIFNANHENTIDWPALLGSIDEITAREDAPEILLVEGHLLFVHEFVRERFDLRLFIDLEGDQRAIRRMLRDMKGGRSNSDPEFIGTYFLECARVGHNTYIEPSKVHADFLLRGDADWKRIVPKACGLIESMLD